MELDRMTLHVLDLLADKGADQAWCEATVSETREFNVENGTFSLYRTLFDNTLTMTAYKGHRKGQTQTNRFDDDTVAKAAGDCIQIAEAGEPDEAWCLAPEAASDSFVLGVAEPDMDLLFQRTQELLSDVQREYPKIHAELVVSQHRQNRSVYRNSNGTCFQTLEGYYELSFEYVAREGEKTTSLGYDSVVTASLAQPLLEQGSIRSGLEATLRQLDAVPMEGKFVGDVLLTPACFGELLSSALVSFAGGTAILEGSSIWEEKLNTQVADSRLTLDIAPLDARIVCGERYTAEGYVSENYRLLDHGVLKCFQLSNYVARKTGHARARNTSASTYCMEPGEASLQSLIASIDHGALIGGFSGGAPANNGDFSGVAKNSFLIEDGKITQAITETMISGNLAQLLQNLKGLSREVVMDGASVLPWAAFSGVTIAGK